MAELRRSSALCETHAGAERGEPKTARDALEQARLRTPRVARLLDITNKIAAPWVLAEEGDVGAAVAGLLEVARWLRRRGLPTIEAQVLHDVVRLGGARHASERLEQLARVVDGDFARLATRHARAYLARDGAELENVSSEFANFGMLLYAAEAAVHAHQAFRSVGLPQAAHAAAATAWTLVQRCDCVGTPALRATRSRAHGARVGDRLARRA